MTTSKLPAPPAQAEDVSPRRRGTNWQGFRSLSRAMFRGFVRDRAALFFTILFPVLFLLLFGSIYKSSSISNISSTCRLHQEQSVPSRFRRVPHPPTLTALEKA